MKRKIDSRPQSCGNQVTTLQLTEWETGEIAEVLSNKGLMEKNILIEHPSKAGNQCFSYPLSLKSEWTCSLVPNILGKLSSVDTVEFHFSDLPLFLPFMKQYAFIYLTIHQCLISNKLFLLYFEQERNISIELIKDFSNEVAIKYLAFIFLL